MCWFFLLLTAVSLAVTLRKEIGKARRAAESSIVSAEAAPGAAESSTVNAEAAPGAAASPEGDA